MTKQQEDLSPKQESEHVNPGKCWICRKETDHPSTFLCGSKKCRQEYYHRKGLAASNPRNKEERMWQQMELERFYWREGIDYSRDDL